MPADLQIDFAGLVVLLYLCMETEYWGLSLYLEGGVWTMSAGSFHLMSPPGKMMTRGWGVKGGSSRD
jgi:hypothetical protein